MFREILRRRDKASCSFLMAETKLLTASSISSENDASDDSASPEESHGHDKPNFDYEILPSDNEEDGEPTKPTDPKPPVYTAHTWSNTKAESHSPSSSIAF